MSSGRTIIAGGLGALGSVTAAAFADQGWNVVVIDAARATTPRAYPVIDGVDLAVPKSAASAFREAMSRLGGADVLVNLTGGFAAGPVSTAAPELWQDLLAANLTTTVNLCREAAAHLPPGGAIINVGARAAERGQAGLAAYAAAKSGVMRLTESLAAELAGRVRVNAILPAILDTPQNRAAMPDADRTAWTPLEDVADAIVILASREARAITGALIPVGRPA